MDCWLMARQGYNAGAMAAPYKPRAMVSGTAGKGRRGDDRRASTLKRRLAAAAEVSKLGEPGAVRWLAVARKISRGPTHPGCVASATTLSLLHAQGLKCKHGGPKGADVSVQVA